VVRDPGVQGGGQRVSSAAHRGGGRTRRFRSPRRRKEALLAANPEAYYTTPHYDGYPAILVNLAAADLVELRELITESWRIKAPVKLRESFDAASSPQ
jgi:hypothetical protein